MTQRHRWVCVAVGAVVGWWEISLVLPSLFTYNVTPSLPQGWYCRSLSQSPLAIGDYVLLAVPEGIHPALPYGLKARHLLKRIGGLPGQVVCWHEVAMVVRTAGMQTQYLYSRQQHARHPVEPCRLVRADEVLVVGDHPESWDSRYFGSVPRHQLRFRVWPVYTWESASWDVAE